MRLVRWVTSKAYGPLPQSCIPQKQNYYQGALSMDSSNELLSAGGTVWARPSHQIMILNSAVFQLSLWLPVQLVFYLQALVYL